MLEVLVLDLGSEVGGKVDLHGFVDEINVGKTELQNDVVIEFKHVLDGQEDGSESVFNDVLAHLAGGGDGDGIGVDHAESLLEDGALRLSGGDLLFIVVSDGQGLQGLVNHEARF